MELITNNLASIITFFPLLGVLALIAVPSDNRKALFGTALGFAVVEFLLSIPVFFRFIYPDQPVGDRILFEVNKLWIPDLGIHYHLGIDGISLYLVLLTTFLTPLVVLWCYRDIDHRFKEFMAMTLFLEFTMIGVFVARDLVLFYIFFEALLIPMYFMIGIWGGENRLYATYKFVIYTMVGSLLMLAAVFYLYTMTYGIYGGPTSDYDIILSQLHIPPETQVLLFLAFGLAFAIKVPLFPLHTWLPDAHTEAPTAGSVILAAILLKVGTYGFLRFCLPLFPYASLKYATPLMILAVIGITYGAMVAAVQTDVKKLVAYSSVAHLGFVMLGLFAFTPGDVTAQTGSLLQQINHGISTGGLFFLVGFIYHRRHTREFSQLGGLMDTMPMYHVLFLIVMLSSVGLPGLNGFVGEFTILLGAFQSQPWLTAIGTFGVILAAVYLLWMFRKVFHGEITVEENEDLEDVTPLETAVVVPIIIVAVWIGVYPEPFLRPMEGAMEKVVGPVEQTRRAHDFTREEFLFVSYWDEGEAKLTAAEPTGEGENQ